MCGIRRGNQFAKRYRMDKELILECCQEFAKQGIQSFLLESGDDVYYTQKLVEEILIAIKKRYPHSRIILSLGEKPETAYRNWLQAGADSYLLRHGSADETHFRKIYPADMSLLLRKQQLWQLKGMGYHTGTGFLVGIPYQSIDNVVEDMQFIKSFGAAIIDVGAFVPALHSVFERERSGNGEMTAYLLAILRLMLPDAEIIASPTLDCVLREGRMKAVLAGADVLVVDLAETAVMESYRVYDRKNGRMALQLDNIEGIKAQLTGMGLSCEDGGR
jgi:biotin synthase